MTIIQDVFVKIRYFCGVGDLYRHKSRQENSVL